MTKDKKIHAFVEPFYFTYLLSSLISRGDQELPFLTILYDNLYVFDKFVADNLDSDTKKYLSLSFKSADLTEMIGLTEISRYESIKDPYDEEQNPRVMLFLHSILRFCNREKIFFVAPPVLQSNFINFCKTVEPNYVETLKEGFLYYNIGDFIEDQCFPNIQFSFSEISKLKSIIIEFKNGIIGFLKEFKGSYQLNEEQKEYVKKKISDEENKILSLLDLEKLRKISKEELGKEVGTNAIDFFVELTTSLPLGTIINIIKRIYEVHNFKSKNLGFPFSILVLKNIINKGSFSPPTQCKICGMTDFEIKNLTDEEAKQIIFSRMFCVKHMIAYLNARKTFASIGKDLLIKMKDLYR